MIKLYSFRILILIFIINLFALPVCVYAHWADEVLNDFKSQNYISISSTQLNNNVSKGEISYIINKYYNFEDTFLSFEKSLEVAKEKGYFQNANADEFIPREEFAIVICKLIGEDDVSDIIQEQAKFIDDDEVSTWAKPYVFKLKHLDILNGYPNGDFKPHKLLTYAELITILSRIRGKGGGEIQLVDENINDIKLKLLKFSSGEIYTEEINDLLRFNLGNKVELAVMISDDIDENLIEYIILDESIAKFDKKYNLLLAESEGKTKMQVLYKGELQQEFEIVVSK